LSQDPNILSNKKVVKFWTFNVKKDFYKYIKGYVVAKYSGSVIEDSIVLNDLNSVSNVFDLRFISNGNEIFDKKPKFLVYEKSSTILKLFQFPGIVSIEIRNEDDKQKNVEKYSISYQQINLISSFEDNKQIPCQGMFHQREEKLEFGTFKGDAILTVKHTKYFEYKVQIGSLDDSEIWLLDSEGTIMDKSICPNEPIHLFTVNSSLYLHAKEFDYKVIYNELKISLIKIEKVANSTNTTNVSKVDRIPLDEEDLVNEIEEIRTKDLPEVKIDKAPIKLENQSIGPPINNRGCLPLLLEIFYFIILVFYIGYVLLIFLGIVFLLFKEIPLIIGALGLIGIVLLVNWLFPIIVTSIFVPIGRFLSKSVLPFLSVVFIGWLVYSIFSIVPKLSAREPRKFNYSENSIEESKETVYENGLKEFLEINRSWNDYNDSLYDITFRLSLNNVDSSVVNKLNILEKFTRNNEPKVYENLFKNEEDFLSDLILKLDSIKKNNEFTEIGFARVLMSFVQDIPYSLVLQSNCNISNYRNDKFIVDYLSNGGACIGNEKFGILSPTEFIYNTMGDCDTRTVFSYLLFKHFGYDIAIFNSHVYAHSIFGINFKSQNLKGIYKVINNKKYYLWETTSKGFNVGEIPSEIGNVNYWYKVLN
jgi:hypothetical protein